MIRPQHLGIFGFVSAALLLSTTAFAQDDTCADDFVVPSTVVDLCTGEDAEHVDDTTTGLVITTLQDAAGTCADDEACLACALGEAVGVTAECAYCYVDFNVCIQDACSNECGEGLENFEDDDCETCLADADCNGRVQLCIDSEGTNDDNTSGGDNGNGDNGNGDNGNGENGGDTGDNTQVDDPYGKTCSGGPDCKDGEWDVSQTGGRIGSACSMSTEGAGGIAILFFSLLLVAQRRRRVSRA